MILDGFEIKHVCPIPFLICSALRVQLGVLRKLKWVFYFSSPQNSLMGQNNASAHFPFTSHFFEAGWGWRGGQPEGGIPAVRLCQLPAEAVVLPRRWGGQPGGRDQKRRRFAATLRRAAGWLSLRRGVLHVVKMWYMRDKMKVRASGVSLDD